MITQVHEATEKDVDIAVAAARKAFEGSWRQETPENRGKLLTNLANLFEKNIDLLAAVESLDNGKAISMAKVDISMCLAASDTTVVGQTRLPARSSTLLPTPSTTSRRSPLVVCIDFRHSRAEISLFHQSNADNHSSLRSDHSLELPSSHVGMEDWPGHCLR